MKQDKLAESPESGQEPPEILEKLEILDHERMDLFIGPYPIVQAMHLCSAFSKGTAPAAGWFALVALGRKVKFYLRNVRISNAKSS